MTAIDVTTTSAASCDPGLNPNQPTSRMNTPMMANGTEWPGIALGFPSAPYFPMRGPRIEAPIIAAHPPTLCTTVEPAKSMKGVSSCASQPPPQNQCTTIGYTSAVMNDRVDEVARELRALGHRA